MTPVIQKDIRDFYASHHKLIFHCARKFKMLHGGDLLELTSDANFAFYRAWEGYEEGKSRPSTWICLKIWKYLLSRKRIKQGKRELTMGEEEWVFLDRKGFRRKSRFDYDAFRELLSHEGQEVVRIAMESKACTEPEGLDWWRYDVRDVLRRSLLGMGWKQHAVDKVFTEVYQTLARYHQRVAQ